MLTQLFLDIVLVESFEIALNAFGIRSILDSPTELLKGKVMLFSAMIQVDIRITRSAANIKEVKFDLWQKDRQDTDIIESRSSQNEQTFIGGHTWPSWKTTTKQQPWIFFGAQ